jgi:hypothetical protein
MDQKQFDMDPNYESWSKKIAPSYFVDDCLKPVQY